MKKYELNLKYKNGFWVVMKVVKKFKLELPLGSFLDKQKAIIYLEEVSKWKNLK